MIQANNLRKAFQFLGKQGWIRGLRSRFYYFELNSPGTPLCTIYFIISSMKSHKTVPQVGMFFKLSITLALWSTRCICSHTPSFSGNHGLISDMRKAVNEWNVMPTHLFILWLAHQHSCGRPSGNSVSVSGELSGRGQIRGIDTWLINFIYTDIALKGGIQKLNTKKAKAEACKSINAPSTMELALSGTAKYLWNDQMLH